MHQCTQFATNPRQLDDNTIKYLYQYILAMQDKGSMMHPDLTKSFEVHVGCDFAGN
jgi:hypothetical protein